MRAYELECIHGVGHSSGVHGCDGCCALLIEPAVKAERTRLIESWEKPHPPVGFRDKGNGE